jgi:putative ABC transport system substrate-binding protein
MVIKTLSFLLVSLALTSASLAEAQQTAKKVPRIGFLTTGGRATSAAGVEAFRQGLRELGYVEGKNINIEYRYAEGRFERLPELAKELVRLKVDIFLVPSAAAARPATKVTATIPIVMVNAGDPIASGVVASLARPAAVSRV